MVLTQPNRTAWRTVAVQEIGNGLADLELDQALSSELSAVLRVRADNNYTRPFWECQAAPQYVVVDLRG
jgi:hypothetical protein